MCSRCSVVYYCNSGRLPGGPVGEAEAAVQAAQAAAGARESQQQEQTLEQQQQREQQQQCHCRQPGRRAGVYMQGVQAEMLTPCVQHHILSALGRGPHRSLTARSTPLCNAARWSQEFQWL